MATSSEQHNMVAATSAAEANTEYRDIPLTWLSGSEEALRRLTRAICHTDPDLFQDKKSYTAVYRAGTVRRRSAFLSGSTPRMTSLGELAIRLNPFIGERWVSPSSHLDLKQREPCRLRITVEPPSAHDRAEALRTLLEMLDDKLHDPQKRVHAGLPPYPFSAEQTEQT